MASICTLGHDGHRVRVDGLRRDHEEDDHRTSRVAFMLDKVWGARIRAGAQMAAGYVWAGSRARDQAYNDQPCKLLLKWTMVGGKVDIFVNRIPLKEWNREEPEWTRRLMREMAVAQGIRPEGNGHCSGYSSGSNGGKE